MNASLAIVALLQVAAPRGGGGTFLIIQVVLILGIFYFLMIRPQQQQRKKQEALLLALKKGDDIVTSGGIVGRVVHIKEGSKGGTPGPTLDDQVTIQSGESRLIVERGRIARVGGAAAVEPTPKKEPAAPGSR